MEAAIGVPDMAVAKEHAKSLMPHAQDGQQLPLSCPIECFQVFGSGVYAYMRWAQLMKNIFFVCFLFSLANMVNNIFGGELKVKTWLSVHTLGNVDRLNASYGATEVVVLFTLVWGMFAAVRIVRREEALLKPFTTPADHTILIKGLPTSPPITRQALIEGMCAYGDVTHAVVSLPIRRVILRVPERTKLVEQLQISRIRLFMARFQQDKDKRKPLMLRVEEAERRLQGHDAESKAMLQDAMRGRHETSSGARSRVQPVELGASHVDHSSFSPTDDATATPLSPPPSPPSPPAVEGHGTADEHAQPATASQPAKAKPRRSSMLEAARKRGELLDLEEGRHSGGAFISFDTVDAAKKALKAIKAALARHSLASDLPLLVEASRAAATENNGRGRGIDHRSRSRILPAQMGSHLHAQRAPEPSDVLWENLQAGPREQGRRQLLSTLCMLAVACIGTCIIAFVVYINGTGLYHTVISLPDGFRGFLAGLALQLGMALPIIIGNVMLFFSVPVLAEKHERHHTVSSMQRAIMLKLTFFQVFNTVVAAAVFFIEPTVREKPRQWYSLGGAMIVNVMLGDALFIQVLLDFVQIPVVIAQHFRAPRMKGKTQNAMNEMYAAPAGIYLAFRLQLAGKFVIITATFGSAIPLLYLIAALYFWLAAWIDRYNFLRRLTPPPVTDASLTSAMTLVVFPVAVGLHVIMALLFLGTLPTITELGPDGEPLLSPSYPPPMLPPMHSPLLPNDTVANASAAANASWLLPLPPALPPAPPALPAPPLLPFPYAPPAPPPPFIDFLRAGVWDAFHVMLAAAGLAACFLACFVFYECAAARNMQLPQILSRDKQRVILKVITQEPDDEEEDLSKLTQPLSSGNRNSVYLPPLPSTLLATLGLGGLARREAKDSVIQVERASTELQREANLSMINDSAFRPLGTPTGAGSHPVGGSGAPLLGVPYLSSRLSSRALSATCCRGHATPTELSERREEPGAAVAPPPPAQVRVPSQVQVLQAPPPPPQQAQQLPLPSSPPLRETQLRDATVGGSAGGASTSFTDLNTSPSRPAQGINTARHLEFERD